MDRQWLIDNGKICFNQTKQRDLDASANGNPSSVYAISYAVIGAADLFRETGDEDYADFCKDVCKNWGQHLPAPVLGTSNESNALKGVMAMAHAAKCLIAGKSTGRVGQIIETCEDWLGVFIPARIPAYQEFGYYDKVARAGYACDALIGLGRRQWNAGASDLRTIFYDSRSFDPFWWYENRTNDVMHRSDTVHWLIETDCMTGYGAHFFNEWVVRDAAKLEVNTFPGIWGPSYGIPLDMHHQSAIVAHGWPKLALENDAVKSFFDALVTETMYQLEHQSEERALDIGRHKDWRYAMTMIGAVLGAYE